MLRGFPVAQTVFCLDVKLCFYFGSSCASCINACASMTAVPSGRNHTASDMHRQLSMLGHCCSKLEHAPAPAAGEDSSIAAPGQEQVPQPLNLKGLAQASNPASLMATGSNTLHSQATTATQNITSMNRAPSQAQLQSLVPPDVFRSPAIETSHQQLATT